MQASGGAGPIWLVSMPRWTQTCLQDNVPPEAEWLLYGETASVILIVSGALSPMQIKEAGLPCQPNGPAG